MGLSSIALAAPNLPAPGSASAVMKAVLASTSITTLSSTVQAKVASSPNDNAGRDYPGTSHGCMTMKSCVFGDKKASKLLVIMGDSHAQMWIPALNRIGTAHKMRVVVLYMARCPAASLDVWLSDFDTAYTACSSARSTWMTAMVKAHPATILLTDHTNDVYTAASNGTAPFTGAQWQTGMETTISDLKPSKARIAVIGDMITMNQVPAYCLAANPGNVQSCSTPDPNPSKPDQRAAEQAAAVAEHILYVDPDQWLCTPTSCSPVIGNFIAYYDTFHVSCTYAAYLSGVLGTALRKVL